MRVSRGGFVCALHEIPAQQFAGFVDCFKPAQPVPLSDLVRRCKDGKSIRGLFSITVDDGVGDNVRALARLFLARQWPATFYLPTQYVETGEGMAFQWWRNLKPHLPRRKLELRSRFLDLSPAGAVEALSKRMETLWHSQPQETYFPLIRELIEVVERERGIVRAALQPSPPISWAEAYQLSRTDLIRFESHGVTHTAMSALTEAELLRELRHSRDLVSERCGYPCRHLAYPFGSPLSIGTMASAAAKLFYDSAATMTSYGGDVDRADPWLLPRIPLYASNSRLSAWLKTRLRYSRAGLRRGESPSAAEGSGGATVVCTSDR
ncbi:MAG TPA: polysaccharide deacetylase family protein [Bryobacteraceae bacterium]|nr:polysaccharide deacetylase family protein [Bryobacteraceae bacterium]